MIAEDFFRERLEDAVAALGRPVSPEATQYLVGMLSGFIWDTPDWEMVGYRYLTSLGTDRIVVLKSIGDSSLFLLGFFAEHARQSSVGPGYYAQVGGTAYGELASRFSRHGGAVFGELAGKFPAARAVVARVRMGLSVDRLAEYKEWLSNRSGAAEASLRQSGLLVG